MTLKHSLLPTLLALALAAPVFAQDENLPDIGRDGIDLEGEMIRPTDLLRYDTALVLTSRDASARRVVCTGHGENGQVVGRGAVLVPAHGIRHALASELGAGPPLLASVVCRSPGRVSGTAFLLGGAAGVTSIPTRVRGGSQGTVTHFPIVFAR